MAETQRFPIVLHQTFIEATRDTGYRSTAAAIAELVDNAIQADAKNIRILIEDGNDGVRVAVLDDGSGMDSSTLRRALQFGGSKRFADRSGLGRFGMGLPNASVSQARRLDVFTWRAPNACFASNLDVDEISAGKVDEIPSVRRTALPKWAQEWRSFSGTLVTWTRCDRIDNRRVSTVVRKLHEPLGRMFRHFLWKGVKIFINGEKVQAIDPLFLHKDSPLKGAVGFGAPLTFEVRVPGKTDQTSVVRVRFAELPVSEWHDLPVEEKRKHGIVDGAGLSILRAGREVDYGWWFFGAKRRENYDSWWRGELSFGPDLDEAFSITHSKQGISPTPEIREILTPDLEAIARQLNGRVQRAFGNLKGDTPTAVIPIKAPEIRDTSTKAESSAPAQSAARSQPAKSVKKTPLYTVKAQRLGPKEFFKAASEDGKWVLTINSGHAFHRTVYSVASDRAKVQLERMLLAHAKAVAGSKKGQQMEVGEFRSAWAVELASLLEADE
jgi:hypothetical protein